jgi:acetyltransferase-like isoleucine patch superfamily enzyme
MIKKQSNKPLAAISYDTKTYDLLCRFLSIESDEAVTRILPDVFLKNPSADFQYINLVVKDFDLRKNISGLLDSKQLDRWTFIADDGSDAHQALIKNDKIIVGQGCFIYPAVWAYSGQIGKDVIIHSWVKLAEGVSIGDGTFISGEVTIPGSCKIGKWCFIGNNIFFIDNVSITDNVKLLPGTNLRKSINKPGTYYNPNMFRIEEIVV